MSASPAGLKCTPTDFRNGSEITLLRRCTIAVGVLILHLLPARLQIAFAHCLLIQRGMEANAQGSSVAEWSQSSGILHEDLGTVEAPLDSFDHRQDRASPL